MVRISILPALAVVIPLISVAVISRRRTGEKAGNWLTVATHFFSFVVVAMMYPAIRRGEILVTPINQGSVIDMSFMADSLSLLVGLIAIFVWALVSFYSIEYMGHLHAQKRYAIFSSLSLVGMLGVVFTRNLFALYIYFEMLSVCSYVMVIHEETAGAHKAGLKYLFMGFMGGLILLASIIATYIITGTGDLMKISELGLGVGGHPAMPLIFAGYIIGFGIKAGLFPVHIWLPDAHPVAPSPASALLSGVMIKAGAYGIIRTVFTIMGIGSLRHEWVLGLLFLFALINIFLGSAMAIKQVELKRMLAYSSVSQIGYVILGITLLSPYGVMGGLIHIFNHAIIKGTLFLCAGAIIHQTGLRQLEDLKGIGKRMPITTACFTIGAFSMVGFPPFNGFVSKWFLALGCLQTAEVNNIGLLALGMLLLSSLMNLIYYGPVIYRAWFVEGELLPKSLGAAAADKNDDPNLFMIIPLVLLALGIVFFGIFPQLPVKLAGEFSQMLFH
jgi:multicomponent Na+:H+ antiporter subunit D